MTSGVQSLVPGIVDATMSPALARIPANFRVTASGQTVGVIGDVVTFNGLPTASGSWVTGSFRVSINALPVITQTSTGVSVLSAGPPGGPIRVQLPDFRVQAG